jgi:DNA-binding NarL/FixJ family response regulator
VRAVIADDDLLVRAGIAALLRDAGVEVVAQAATGEDLVREVDAHEPDVAIVDVRMPPTHSDEGLRAAGASNSGPLRTLTPREREVLQLVAEGRSNQAVADALVITVRSVEKYVSSIFSKLGLPDTGSDHRRVLAVLQFLQA